MMKKSNGIIVVQLSFEKLDFFQLRIKKVGFIVLTLSEIQILKTNLWLIYSKQFEFMVYTFIFAF